MEEKLLLQADAELTYSINTQLKEQLKWLIGMSRMVPGDMLPAAGDLADQLGINRNTVSLVYTQLKDEGIVSIQKGKGTQVLDGSRVEELMRKRKPMYELWERMVEEASENHLELRELAVAGMAFVQLFGNQASIKPTLLFIECKEHDHIFYRKEIARLSGATVQSFFLEQLPDSMAEFEKLLSQADAVVTTLNHSDEVHKLTGTRKTVLTIGATIDFSLLLEIAKLSSGSKVGFVCLGQKGGQWMAQRVKEAGVQHIEYSALGTNNPQALERFADGADKIYASSAVYDEVKSLAPDKTVHFPLILEKSSENLLKDFLKI
ncbi:GntR family transcriptional regulator [Paenibacillus harenae]|uniref:GntR family transcriptional regulator n=1 Tax=Paenibacillus harenae TaxID=306543 RepID=UPI002791803F|nr:GntR family transcriptional regulator [Paenibacillus harenae]MDQ0061697.1 GntR family transcriptional regulator [Paenibacillus harenae]